MRILHGHKYSSGKAWRIKPRAQGFGLSAKSPGVSQMEHSIDATEPGIKQTPHPPAQKTQRLHRPCLTGWSCLAGVRGTSLISDMWILCHCFSVCTPCTWSQNSLNTNASINTMPEIDGFACACLCALALHVLSLGAARCISFGASPVWRTLIFCNRNISDSRVEAIKLKSLCSIVWHVILISSHVSLVRVQFWSPTALHAENWINL